MATSEITKKILYEIEKLPQEKQSELLDFAMFLNINSSHHKHDAFHAFSLDCAMEDMRDEDSPYTLSDIKEKF